ncbi:TPA: hypothetical protein DIC20_02290 [Candidatus Dependentiae bacterium]|nr:MAG: hypothetical protein US03_C0003G0017 [candidate division TM6 bacterium GW2011_GWF2_36_131]KKQ03336.1 MAG: hypothetical protein US13_C0003G0017 [candidate division TM6 bacterium GW2011_GWE2_36_25]KKQ19732.1 MAG: hypothetical protein US32_C0005G0016 [candidate division TM6 bacterium GW2011_GWA2_36_9]HBR70886.1 hypothetical protein [Candidatus Dependentiae bacterium]HCU00511.1 hypothetical protein [Candidatus Dependentiae bacterium]
MNKSIIFLTFFLCAQELKSFPKTEYPLTHFFLNLIGPICIIKGSSLSIPGLNWFLNIEKEVNWPLMTAGAFCLITSRILFILEKKAQNEYDDYT